MSVPTRAKLDSSHETPFQAALQHKSYLDGLLPFIPLPFYVWVFVVGNKLHDQAALYVIYLAVAQIVYMGCLVMLRGRHISLTAVASSAVISIILLLPHSPTISTDIYRYIWDGRVTTSHQNVFTVRPNQLPALQKRDGLYDRMQYREEYTVYPPLAQVLFVGANALYEHAGIWAVKLFFGLPYFGIGFLLWRLLAGIEQRRWLYTCYALNPLLLFELFGSGHVDGWAVLLIVGAYYFYTTKRLQMAISLVLLAGLIKLWPLMLLPALFVSYNRQLPRRDVVLNALRSIVTVSVLTTMAYLPFVRHTLFAITRLQSWSASMSFNGAYTALLSWLGLPHMLIQRSALLLLVIVVLATALKRDLLAAWLMAIIAFLVISPVYYPWYGIVLVPLAILDSERRRFGVLAATLTLMALSGLTYIQQIDEWTSTTKIIGQNGVLVAEAMVLIGLVGYLWKRSSTSKNDVERRK